jgi:uncharacterized membrane protein YkoI
MTVTLSFAACAYAAPGKAEEAKMKAEAKITEKAAQKTALEAVSKGKVIESELEKENGLLVWSFDISKPGTKNITEIQVDAKTGKIVSNTVETEADQAKEKAQESGK